MSGSSNQDSGKVESAGFVGNISAILSVLQSQKPASVYWRCFLVVSFMLAYFMVGDS